MCKIELQSSNSHCFFFLFFLMSWQHGYIYYKPIMAHRLNINAITFPHFSLLLCCNFPIFGPIFVLWLFYLVLIFRFYRFQDEMCTFELISNIFRLISKQPKRHLATMKPFFNLSEMSSQ